MAVKRTTNDERRTTKHQFGRIGVLMGGPSTEREISLKSGKAVYEALKQAGLDVVGIDIKTDSIKENIRLIGSKKLDCAFIALHGRFGEDGQIQQIMEEVNIPYTGSGPKASRLAMDKIASREIFARHNLNVPKYKVLNKNADWEINPDFIFPLVIKPATHGSSIGLSVVDKKKELKKGIDLAFHFDDRVIIEEYISGREVTVGILNDEALAIIEIVPNKKFFDYEAKYQSAATEYIVPAKLKNSIAKKIQATGLSAHKLLGCFGCSRVDIILDKNNLPFVLEINTIPGLTSTSLLPKAARNQGIEFSQLCFKLIKLAYEKKKAK